jgi:hypothetical protein
MKDDPKKPNKPRELTPEEARVIAGGPIGENQNGNSTSTKL